MFQAIDTCDLGRVQGGQQPTIPGRIDPLEAGQAGVEGARQGRQSGGNTGAALGRAATITNPILRAPAEAAGRWAGERVGEVGGFINGAARNVGNQVRRWLPW
jgi:hypothetical protein